MHFETWLFCFQTIHSTEFLDRNSTGIWNYYNGTFIPAGTGFAEYLNLDGDDFRAKSAEK